MPDRPNHLGLPFSGEALKDIRVQAGLNRTKLAEKVSAHGHKVHRTNIGRIERGDHMPSPELLKALADVLGVTVDDLLTTELERSRSVRA